MPEKTDFAAILNQLREWGVNDYRLAELTGIERSKLSKLRTGDKRQAFYDDGVAIMEVYKRQSRPRNDKATS